MQKFLTGLTLLCILTAPAACQASVESESNQTAVEFVTDSSVPNQDVTIPDEVVAEPPETVVTTAEAPRMYVKGDNVFSELVAENFVFDIDFGTELNVPIIAQSDSVNANRIVRSVQFFAPTHSPDRDEVNPAEPVVTDGRTISFNEAGEYYLLVNKRYPFKILVLDETDTVSTQGMDIFNFLSANIASNAFHDAEYVKSRWEYIYWFFRSEDPAEILCGSVNDFYRKIISSTVKLPIRNVTLAAYTRLEDTDFETYVPSHNVVEMYLPDMKKWVVFDPSSGWHATQYSALEFAEILRDGYDKDPYIEGNLERTLPYPSYNRALGVPDKVAAHIKEVVGDPEIDGRLVVRKGDGLFDRSWISETSVSKDEAQYLLYPLFSGGVSYWGGNSAYTVGLPHWYNVVDNWRHEKTMRNNLVKAAKGWAKGAGVKGKTVNAVPLKKMQNQLRTHFQPEICKREWLDSKIASSTPDTILDDECKSSKAKN